MFCLYAMSPLRRLRSFHSNISNQKLIQLHVKQNTLILTKWNQLRHAFSCTLNRVHRSLSKTHTNATYDTRHMHYWHLVGRPVDYATRLLATINSCERDKQRHSTETKTKTRIRRLRQFGVSELSIEYTNCRPWSERIHRKKKKTKNRQQKSVANSTTCNCTLNHFRLLAFTETHTDTHYTPTANCTRLRGFAAYSTHFIYFLVAQRSKYNTLHRQWSIDFICCTKLWTNTAESESNTRWPDHSVSPRPRYLSRNRSGRDVFYC